MTCDPKLYEMVLNSTTRHLKKNLSYEMLKPWLGEGLVIAHGKKWHQHRKLITPAFHFKILEQFVDTFNHQSDILVKKLHGECYKGVVNILPFVKLMTLDTFCETAMGTQINAQNYAESEYVKAIET